MLKALRPKRLDYLFKVRRFGRILVYTILMYLVTHLIVFFYLFPIGTVGIIINPNNASHIKRVPPIYYSQLSANGSKYWGWEISIPRRITLLFLITLDRTLGLL